MFCSSSRNSKTTTDAVCLFFCSSISNISKNFVANSFGIIYSLIFAESCRSNSSPRMHGSKHFWTLDFLEQ